MRDVLFKVEKAAAGALITVLALTILVQVIFRAFFNLPLAWSEEVSRYSFIWLTMMAAPICIREKANIGMDVLTRNLPGRGAVRLEVATSILVLVLAAVLVVWGAAILDVVKTQRSPAIGVP